MLSLDLTFRTFFRFNQYFTFAVTSISLNNKSLSLHTI